MAESLSGTIEHVIFHNADNGFAVLRVRAKGRREAVTVVGNLPSAVVGEYIEATGDWVNDRDHGQQFKARDMRTTPPQTAKGIEKFLGSGLIKGIGGTYARKIVEVFGERTLQVIDESPAFLKEVKGIGPKRIELIRQSWQQQKAVRNLLVFLQPHGIGTSRALRIYKTYGDQAIDFVRANPYRLANDIWGIGFKTADELAEKLGIDRASPLRARAAVRYVLKELSGEGHVGYPEVSVIEQTAALTGIGDDVIRAAVESELKEGEIVRGEGETEPWLYLKPLFLAETGTAQLLFGLCQGRHPLPRIDIEAALRWVEQRVGLELAVTQREAIRQAISRKVLVITGGPGVGKTTIVRAILEIFAAKGLRCELCAPTGRAAKRLSETTGHPARTIHRLLEFEPGTGRFQRNQDHPLNLDLLVMDEASMVDILLMYHVLCAMPAHACLVMVGDVDQLPSVGPGTVLADIIASQVVPVVRLTEIFRQAGHSWIVRAAHQVNHGELPCSATAGQGDFYFVPANEPEDILDRILTLIRERIPARFKLDPMNDVQVLTPMNRSALGVRELNQRLQAILNPMAKGGRQLSVKEFRVGDKVIQTVNNYQKEVFNGDIGRICSVDEKEQELTVDFYGRPIAYDFNELEELALAYAITIHKSQGSEYPAVIIPLHTQHYLMLQRNLLYTGITRGKQLVVLVGSYKALATAVHRQDTKHRYSNLRRWLSSLSSGL